jgi:hypothetical protein
MQHKFFEKLYDRFLQRPFAVIALLSILLNGYLYSNIETAYAVIETNAHNCDSSKTAINREWRTIFLELNAQTKDLKQETEGLQKQRRRQKPQTKQ